MPPLLTLLVLLARAMFLRAIGRSPGAIDPSFHFDANREIVRLMDADEKVAALVAEVNGERDPLGAGSVLIAEGVMQMNTDHTRHMRMVYLGLAMALTVLCSPPMLALYLLFFWTWLWPTLLCCAVTVGGFLVGLRALREIDRWPLLGKRWILTRAGREAAAAL
ncbi:hypothetical protein Afil01_52690 [Actinorhabdospora filicis]|uniref:Uncharacterized protein n=2 Tax=Actinorhabdospora filicis TaxID=1785913 RepID=A0A9W6SRD7_9ACTN|nr:hypothetical protein Afil01_52690 [Actinorhabdospora filicis]